MSVSSAQRPAPLVFPALPAPPAVPSPPPMSRSSSSSTLTLVSTPRRKSFDPAEPGTTLTAAAISAPLKPAFLAALSALSKPLHIVGLLATPDSGCATYAAMTSRACAASGVGFTLRHAEYAFDAVAEAIRDLNSDEDVDGVIVYFPLFGGAEDAALRAMIAPRIDVEGVGAQAPTPTYAPVPAPPALPPTAYPCTALAVVRALQHPSVALYDAARPAGHGFEGSTVTIINRSPTVGGPLARLLAADGARVLSVDITGAELLSASDGGITSEALDAPLDALVRLSDAVVSAVPGRFCVDTAALKPGCVAVDLSEGGNFGPDVRERARLFAPRVGGVTILMLQINALVLRRQRERQAGRL